MARWCWTLAMCMLMAAPAAAQRAGDDEERPRGRRGADTQSDDEDMPERDRGGRFGDRGGEGGRGDGGRGGFFRRPNPIFQALDADGDDIISSAELRKAVAALKKLDADGDGSITLEEVSPQGGPGGPGGFDPEQMADRIMQQDKNGDGKLGLNEVDERTMQMFANADTNRDGAIDRAEILAAMEQMRQRFGAGPGGPGGGFGRGGFDARDMLGRYDQNRDGKLSANEVPEEAQRMLQGRDSNEDGFIDAREMEEAARRLGGRFGRGGAPGGEDGDRAGRRGRAGDDEDEDNGASRRRRPETDEDQ
jgi:Ca2+-binding EF-hand superfamily protein